MNLDEVLWAVTDVETTGKMDEEDEHGKHAVCEFAMALTTATEPLDAYRTFVDPQRPIPAQARAIHHISDEDVRGAPTTFPYGIKAPKPHCWVAHNADFEKHFLPRLKDARWLCTMRLAQKVYPDLESYGNQFLRYDLGLHVPHPYLDPEELSLMSPAEFAAAITQFVADTLPHRALPDAVVTRALLCHLLARLPPEAPTTLYELCKWVAEPILLTTCKIGDHRGKPWAEVDRGFLNWLMRPNCPRKLSDDEFFTVSHYLNKIS